MEKIELFLKIVGDLHRFSEDKPLPSTKNGIESELNLEELDLVSAAGARHSYKEFELFLKKHGLIS